MRRMFRIFSWTLATSLLLLVAGWWVSRPNSPDAFYDAPDNDQALPGTLLKQERFERNVPANAIAWRILYSTTRADGTATAASAIVMMARSANASQSRSVVAWTHGTTGVVPGCGPSLLADPFQYVPALEQLLEQGWIYVGTDYAGQGTSGPNPYLIGEGEARSALDSVRAVRKMKELNASEQTVVWGHSQGGHAALWSGILAPSYAPDVPLLGVVGVAPATDLPRLTARIHGTPIGRVMTSFMLRSYSDTYADVEFGYYTSGWRGVTADVIAQRCLADWRSLFSVGAALTAGDSIFDVSPVEGALGARLIENVPTGRITQPLLIAQGASDDLVLESVQSNFVHDRCAAGQIIDYRRYEGHDHLSIVRPASPLNADLVQWTSDRFAGKPFVAECRQSVVGIAVQ